KREGALNEMVSASSDVVKLGRVRFGEGQEDMFTILRVSGENLAAKIELTKIRASRLRERVNLHSRSAAISAGVNGEVIA
ncbi:MAG: hypothetical protein HC778_06975, partial [Chamaesiphon sp. CSU_1_12]|nr:hypothetical protein [Chamaesiphon sp. CSU_1_12]